MNDNLVLVAEDDRDVRELVSFAIESAGFDVLGARDGRTAARLLAVAQPVALITDVRMPDMNGLDLCRLVRRNAATRDTTILMLSAGVHRYDVDAGMTAGADRYLPKPVMPRRLVDELRTVIAQKAVRTPS
jgi:two-component system response regulator MtrA